MKIEDIQPGKVYWKGHTKIDGRTKYKEVIAVKIYVIQVDVVNKKVLASINGMPAQWVLKQAYFRWVLDNPSQPKQRQ